MNVSMARPPVLLLVALLAACGGGGPGTEIAFPDIEGIIRGSLPPAFLEQGPSKPVAAAARGMLDATVFKTSFFQPGPTDALMFLHNVKERLAGYVHAASDDVVIPCWTADPVAYTLQPAGEAPGHDVRAVLRPVR
jgi:hypothetical protein